MQSAGLRTVTDKVRSGPGGGSIWQRLGAGLGRTGLFLQRGPILSPHL